MGMVHSWSNVLPDDGNHVMFLDNFKAIVQSPNDYTVVTIQGPFYLSQASPPLLTGRLTHTSPFIYLFSNIYITAGVLQSELADWADSPERGYGRFSYLTQNVRTSSTGILKLHSSPTPHGSNTLSHYLVPFSLSSHHHGRLLSKVSVSLVPPKPLHT